MNTSFTSSIEIYHLKSSLHLSLCESSDKMSSVETTTLPHWLAIANLDSLASRSTLLEAFRLVT